MPDVMTIDTIEGARLTRLPPMTRLLLRGDPAVLGPAFQLELPTAPCTSVTGEPSALWLGPDEWLVLSAERDDRWSIWDSEHGAATDISARQVGLSLEGPRASEALAVGCPLDLDIRSFPTGTCTRTVLGKAEIVLWRSEDRRFHLDVWRSYLGYVEALLSEGIRDLHDGFDEALGTTAPGR